jgi:hypothetical protein
MSSVPEIFVNPTNKGQRKQRMAHIQKDPCLKLILDEIENGGPAVMMRFKHLFLKSYFIVLAFPYFHHKLLWCKLDNNF